MLLQLSAAHVSVVILWHKLQTIHVIMITKDTT